MVMSWQKCLKERKRVGKLMKIIVTTGQKSNADVQKRAEQYAKELGCLFIAREGHSIESLRAEYGASAIVVAKKSGVAVYTPGGELFFHLNMAQLRIKNLLAGITDSMAVAMGLKQGMMVLDCTLGMGTDSIMAAYITGNRVIALESSPVTSLIVREGLRFFKTENKKIMQALANIEVVNADYNEYLKHLPDNSFDIVYIDPMFRHPIKESSHLLPMRDVADKRAIKLETLQEAKRVARLRVVVKEGNHSSEFERLGINKFSGGKYSSIAYGVIECGE